MGDIGSLVVMTAGLLPESGSRNAETLSDDEVLKVWTAINQNLYTYVGNNPVNHIDPLGLVDLEIELTEAIASGDAGQIELILDAGDGVLSDSEMAAGRAALQKLRTKCVNLIRGSLKRSSSYHSELENDTYEQLLKDSSKAAKQMRKLIEQSKRLMEKNK